MLSIPVGLCVPQCPFYIFSFALVESYFQFSITCEADSLVLHIYVLVVAHALMYFKMHDIIHLYMYNISPAGIWLAAEGFVCWSFSLHLLIISARFIAHTEVK